MGQPVTKQQAMEEFWGVFARAYVDACRSGRYPPKSEGPASPVAGPSAISSVQRGRSAQRNHAARPRTLEPAGSTTRAGTAA